MRAHTPQLPPPACDLTFPPTPQQMLISVLPPPFWKKRGVAAEDQCALVIKVMTTSCSPAALRRPRCLKTCGHSLQNTAAAGGWEILRGCVCVRQVSAALFAEGPCGRSHRQQGGRVKCLQQLRSLRNGVRRRWPP